MVSVAEVHQVVDAKSAQIGKDAHKDDVQKAAENLFNDNSFKAATEMPDHEISRVYTARMTEDLVKQNLLPSVSISFVERKFDKIDTNNEAGKTPSLTLAEVRAAQNAANCSSIDARLYKEVGDMMENGQLPKEMTKIQLQEKLKEINTNFQSQDKKNAVDAASLLMNNRALFNNVAQNDEQITKDDLRKFLEKPGNASEDTIRKLTWLRDNWDDRDVKALMRIDPKGAGFMNEESIRDGINTLKKDIVVEPGKPVDYGKPQEPASKIPPKVNWGPDTRPPSANSDDKSHQWYVSDGMGNTVAVDYDGNGRMIYTVGTVDAAGNAHYTGWHYEKETGKYVLLDKEKILAEATAIDFDPSSGRLTPRGLMPRPSQEERARQNGAY